MGRGWQRERTIQHDALKWLADRYSSQHPSARVCYIDEAVVKESGRHWGRADGLVAVRFADGEVHTVALEAKSMRTRDALRGREGCVGMFAGTLLTCAIFGAAIGSFAVPRFGLSLGLPLAIAGGFVTGLVFLRWAAYSPRFFAHAVLEQVRRYPAGEHWIAITKDFAVHHPAAVEGLLARCRSEGVGVLAVDRKHRVDVLHDVNTRTRRDSLAAYRLEATIRARLDQAKPRQALRLER
jgi:hypothetical protein